MQKKKHALQTFRLETEAPHLRILLQADEQQHPAETDTRSARKSR